MTLERRLAACGPPLPSICIPQPGSSSLARVTRGRLAASAGRLLRVLRVLLFGARRSLPCLIKHSLTHDATQYASTLPSKRQDTSSPPVQSSQSRPKRLSRCISRLVFSAVAFPSHATTSAPACPVLSHTHPLPPFRVVSLARACCAVGRASTAACLCLVDLPSSNPTLPYPIFFCTPLLRLVLAGMK